MFRAGNGPATVDLVRDLVREGIAGIQLIPFLGIYHPKWIRAKENNDDKRECESTAKRLRASFLRPLRPRGLSSQCGRCFLDYLLKNFSFACLV
jgi:hypothetical protein